MQKESDYEADEETMPIEKVLKHPYFIDPSHIRSLKLQPVYWNKNKQESDDK